jgi:predicted metal-binding membrane protein
MAPAVLERILRHDRAVVIVTLALLLLLAWSYLLWIGNAVSMGGMQMPGFRMVPAGFAWMAPTAAPWSPLELALVFVMWTVMMIGMMVPSAAPMLLIYAQIGRQAAAQRKPYAATAWFAAGYLIVWSLFSLAATLAQWRLEQASLLDATMTLLDRRIGGAVLLTAGVYQWLALKGACLQRCRAPLTFIQQQGGFRRDATGALRLGMRHGLYCVGCCWMLMLLLFVGGIMNLLWIAALAGLVLIEKITPLGAVLARIAGVGLVIAGLWLWMK